MKIKVNGREMDLTYEQSIAELLKTLDIPQEGTAVAHNLSVVPKREYEQVILREGDAIEIIRAVAGG